jgi:hypothetical protein
VARRRIYSVIAVVGLVTVAGASLVRRLLPGPDFPEDCASGEETRYAALRDRLPASGVVGFVGPEEMPSGCNARQIAAYALAPLLVVPFDGRRRIESEARDVVVPDVPAVVVVDGRAAGVETWWRTHPEYRAIVSLDGGLSIAARLAGR